MRPVDIAAGVATGALTGRGWKQAGELGAALVLSACVGVERQIRQKGAGLRTHTLVGLGAAPLSRPTLIDGDLQDPGPVVEVLLRVHGKSRSASWSPPSPEVDDVASVLMGDDPAAGE
jgi:hypothetical protein